MSINVEIPNPAAFYLRAKHNIDLLKIPGAWPVKGPAPYIYDILSEEEMDYELFSFEETIMSVNPQVQHFLDDSHEEIWYEHGLRSTLHISPQEFEKEPFGFYSPARVRKIQLILNRMGVSCEFDGDENDDDTCLDLFPDENNLVHIEFGFASQKKAEDVIANNIKNAGTKFERDMWLARLVHLPEERHHNQKLTTSLMNAEGYNYIEDKDSFVKSVLAYASTYQAFLRALYEERGMPEPSVNLTLQLSHI